LLYSIFKAESIVTSLVNLSKSFNVKFIIIASLINIIIIFNYLIFKKHNGTINLCFSKIPKSLLSSLLIFFFFLNASLAFTRMYGIIPIEQFIFHLAFQITGANYSMVTNFLIKPLIDSVVMLLFSTYLLSTEIYIKKYLIEVPFKKIKKSVVLATVLLPIAGIIVTTFIIKLPQYIVTSSKEAARFYEDNYIFPETVNIFFPDEKRNLIVIIVESLETGFLKITDGGAFAEDLIPEIAELSKNNISYASQNTGIGGVTQLYGTEWTVAGLTAYYLGVPLAVNFLNQTGWNNYGSLGDEFLPGAYGIKDILYREGYNNYFILGSDIAFGGMDKLFKTHKNTNIFDYNYFHNNNYIPSGYKVWWGLEDRKLYKLAKTKITEISQQNEPFFITLSTLDTHPVEGYLDEFAEIIFDSQYKNVLRDTSKQLDDFIEWLRQQPFYENTTVVILGDHLYQDSSFFPQDFQVQKLASRYERKYFDGKNEDNYNRFTMNIFINSLLPPNENKNRKISHFDILPLLIESIGGSFNEKGLALGRSLNIPEENNTLVEQYGVKFVNEQLKRKSILYNRLWGIIE